FAAGSWWRQNRAPNRGSGLWRSQAPRPAGRIPKDEGSKILASIGLASIGLAPRPEFLPGFGVTELACARLLFLKTLREANHETAGRSTNHGLRHRGCSRESCRANRNKDLSDRNVDRRSADSAHRRHRKDARGGSGQAGIQARTEPGIRG